MEYAPVLQKMQARILTSYNFARLGILEAVINFKEASLSKHVELHS